MLLRCSRTYLLQQVSLLDRLQDVLLGRLLGFSAQKKLVEDEVGLLEVEDYVQLAHLYQQRNDLVTRNYHTFS